MMKRICVISKDKKKDEGILEIDEDRLVNVSVVGGAIIVDKSVGSIQVRRGCGQLVGKALYLDDSLDYELGMDDNIQVLVPLKKKKG